MKVSETEYLDAADIAVVQHAQPTIAEIRSTFHGISIDTSVPSVRSETPLSSYLSLRWPCGSILRGTGPKKTSALGNAGKFDIFHWMEQTFA